MGAGSADKTRLLLSAAVDAQGAVLYEPVDVSANRAGCGAGADYARFRGVTVSPRVMDYVHGLDLDSEGPDERRLVLYIGSSIGNFEPEEAAQLLVRIREALRPGDALLLGVDLVKRDSILLAAYDDAAGVTAEFNLNLLTRLNRELGANFNLRAFRHKAIWDAVHSRIEIYLESLSAQKVNVRAPGAEGRVWLQASGSIRRTATSTRRGRRSGCWRMRACRDGLLDGCRAVVCCGG